MQPEVKKFPKKSCWKKDGGASARHFRKTLFLIQEKQDDIRGNVPLCRVENEKEGSRSKAKQESSSDEEIEEPKKRTRGGRRKKAQ